MKGLFISLLALSTLFILDSCTHDPIVTPVTPETPIEPIICNTPEESSFTNECNPDTVYYSQIAVIFNASCGSNTTGCHNTATDDNKHVDLSTWWQVMNSGDPDDEDYKLIDLVNPTESKILEEIDDNDMPYDEGLMHISGAYRDELYSTILQWIQQGALNN